ncbi:hypothetical protein [Marinobacter alkaliphilus]|uniref:Uncharacterized protein n=1 Tax=Marinobacter alkaliphilus TaxID=254719 RepID=A0ABZ3E916_9GAMM
MLAPLLTLTALIIAGLFALWLQSVKARKQKALLTLNTGQQYLIDLQPKVGSSAKAKRSAMISKSGGTSS